VIARSFRIAALCLSATLIGASAVAETPAAPATASAPGPTHPFMGYRAHSAFHHVLRQLNLTAEQKTQIHAIFAEAKTGMQPKLADARANHEALMAASPNDASYPALLAAEKANAAARVQAMSDVKAQIYAVLTPEQQAKIPQIIAAHKAARQAKMAAWRANHPAD
jgi:periplasmic protein CpxP/Spy